MIKKILDENYLDVLDLRDRIGPEGSKVISDEDYMILDTVLDLYDLLIDSILNDDSGEVI